MSNPKSEDKKHTKDLWLLQGTTPAEEKEEEWEVKNDSALDPKPRSVRRYT